ncbi:MAG TPA: hypothetical protein VMU16_02315 [Candidatus Binataceae bacterium]|nr:hypothetical protein [Candidatus Binataceae bacterium]
MLSNYARFYSVIQCHLSQAVYRLRLEEIAGDATILVPGPDGSNWADLADAKFWKGLRTSFEEIDLESALSQLDRICDAVESPGINRLHRSQFRALIQELINRIEDDLGKRLFLYIPISRVGFWEEEALFGDEVLERIPEATDDIYEAGSCFAAGRAGGTVYHCIGIMQAALFKVGQKLGCTINLELDDWGTVTTKITDAVNVLRLQAEAQSKAGDAATYAAWRASDAAYAELLSDVNAVKKAWRNPSAHFRQKYTLDHAGKILGKVGDFVKHAATLLP